MIFMFIVFTYTTANLRHFHQFALSRFSRSTQISEVSKKTLLLQKPLLLHKPTQLLCEPKHYNKPQTIVYLHILDTAKMDGTGTTLMFNIPSGTK